MWISPPVQCNDDILVIELWRLGSTLQSFFYYHELFCRWESHSSAGQTKGQVPKVKQREWENQGYDEISSKVRALFRMQVTHLSPLILINTPTALTLDAISIHHAPGTILVTGDTNTGETEALLALWCGWSVKGMWARVTYPTSRGWASLWLRWFLNWALNDEESGHGVQPASPRASRNSKE